MKRKKRFCKECGKVIFNRAKNAEFCKKCGDIEVRQKIYRRNPKAMKDKRDWANRNRKLLSRYREEARKKNKEIILLLRKKYGVRTYGDILERLRKEVEDFTQAL